MRKILLVISVALMGLAGKINAQQIDPLFYGQNAWLPDTIGDPGNCSQPPCILSGQLHKKWQEIKMSGARIIRFGGMAPDRNRPTDYQYLRMVDSIRANGMEPMLQVPFHNYRYSAQQAADIVKFVNISSGRKVKYWIIGNEPNLEYKFTSSSQVAPYIRSFASAMKAVDPSIVIVGPELAWYDRTIINGLTTPGGADDITGKDANGKYYIDIFSFHTYPFSGSQTRSDVITKLRSAGGFSDVLSELNNRLSTCNSYHGRSSNPIEVAVTEANIDYANPVSDNVAGLGANSFIGGQFWAEMMGIAMQKNVKFLNFWSVQEGSNITSSLGYLDKVTGRKPVYYHYKMIAENFKGNFCDGKDNLTNVKAFGSNNGKQVSVVIMNQDALASYDYTLRLNNDVINASTPLNININSSIAKEFQDRINPQSTVLLFFDQNGNAIKKVEYSLVGMAELNKTPVVSIPASANIIASGSTTICNGQSVTLTTDPVAGATYTWKRDGITLSSASSANTCMAGKAGSYTVEVSLGYQFVTSSPVIVDIISPVANISTTSFSFCSGDSLRLAANTGTSLIYQWKKEGVVVPGAKSQVFYAKGNGSYTVDVTQKSCTATSTAVTVKAIVPVAVITPASTTAICEGDSVVLKANTGTGLKYIWRKDSAVISHEIQSSYIAKTSGIYTVEVITPEGCSSVSAMVKVIVTKPVATITSSSSSLCYGDSSKLSANTGTGLTYQWKNNGTIISGATQAIYYAKAAGVYSVDVTTNKCVASSAAVKISVTQPMATIAAATATTICNGDSVKLNANTGPGLIYQWKKDGNTLPGANGSSYYAKSSGQYSVLVTNNGCNKTSSGLFVTVRTLTASISSSSTVLQPGGSVMLTAASGTSYSYQWMKNSAIISGATGSVYKATSTGSYQVKITSSGCFAISNSIAINPSTGAPALQAVITPQSSTTVYEGNKVVLKSNTGAGYVYQWKKDGINLSGATSSTYTATSTGSYQVKITSGNQVAWSAPLSIIVQMWEAKITPSGPTTFAAGGKVVLNAPAGTGFIYQWKRNDVAITGATSQSYTATTSGNYQIKITCGSKTDWSAPVTVTVSGTARIASQAISQEEDSATVAGNNSENKLQVSIAPNPSKEDFSLLINATGKEVITVRVYDLTGRIYFETKLTDPNSILRFGENLRPGIFITEVIQGRRRETLKIVKVE